MEDTEQPDERTDNASSAPVGMVEPEQIPVTEEPDRQKTAYAELNDRFLRFAADFENYKKRMARELVSSTSYANEQFAVDLLEVADNFDRALKSDDSSLREGLVSTRLILAAQLQKHGITPIDSCHRPFDPALHEAIAHVPSEEPEGTVIDEVARGYRMHDKVIRYAKVVVSRGNETTKEV